MKDYTESPCYATESCGKVSVHSSQTIITSSNVTDSLEPNCNATIVGYSDILIAIATGIVSSFLTTIIINLFNKWRARRILLKSKRFMEAIEESHCFIRFFLDSVDPILDYYGGIEWFHFPGKRHDKIMPDYYEEQETATGLDKSYMTYKPFLTTIINMIKSDKNGVIYDTIDKSLGIHYNQRLMNISGDLKNRSHNFTDDIFGNIENIPDNNTSLIYYAFFHTLAYCSYIFDLLEYLKIEKRLDKRYEDANRRPAQKTENQKA